MLLLENIEVLQVGESHISPACLEAIDFAGQIARQMGADVYVDRHFENDERFLTREKKRFMQDSSPADWANAAKNRILLVAGNYLTPIPTGEPSAVILRADPLASEATLFAESALADLFGDPEKAPIIPKGHYGAGTASFGVLAALCAIAAKIKRFDQSDIAEVDAAGVLSWVNWKAAVAGDMSNDIGREGDQAEWPVIPCKDGHVALVYQERDWKPMVEMIDDGRLRDEKFSSFNGRAAHRDEYMTCIREWALKLTKQELIELFLEYQIPAAPVLTTADLLTDHLLNHRGAFRDAVREGGGRCKSPVLPHRVEERSESVVKVKPVSEPSLPLAGTRVLDMGIITAGAGVSALLADMGAEVVKIESHTYPDPFRRWAGQSVSPLFKCNNRNKYGVAVDLKTDEGKQQFLELARTADVVVENFRRGVLDRLGFSYEALKAVNPNIILASISGQGLSGPGSNATSFGSTLEASSGFSANTTYEDGVPYITGRNLNYPDQTVVLYAAGVIAAALANEQHGMKLDISQRDVAVFLSGEELEQFSAGEEFITSDNGHAHKTADDEWVAFATDGKKVFGDEAVAGWVKERSAEEVITQLQDAGIGAAVVRHGSDMYRHFDSTGSFVFSHSPNGDLVKGFPFQLRASPMTIRTDSPDVGEHTADFV